MFFRILKLIFNLFQKIKIHFTLIYSKKNLMSIAYSKTMKNTYLYKYLSKYFSLFFNCFIFIMEIFYEKNF